MAGCALLLGVVIVGLALLGVVAGDPLGTAGDRPSAAASVTAAPGPVTTRPVPPPTATARAHPTATGFTNDGYQVPSPADGAPRIPYPRSQQEALALLRTNAVYAAPTGLPVRCPYEPIVTSRAVPRDTMRAAVNAYVDCLMGVWRVPLEQAGYELPRPTVVFFEEVATSPCGNRLASEVAGMYCGANATFYLPYDQRLYTNGDGWATYVLEIVIGHEFGHHLQARTGILGAEVYLENAGLDEDLEYSRRLELQSQCFAGLALNATSYSMGLTRADRTALVAGEGRRGDQPAQPRTHGTPVSSALWFSRGLDSAAVGTCNTFTAPASEVA